MVSSCSSKPEIIGNTVQKWTVKSKSPDAKFHFDEQGEKETIDKLYRELFWLNISQCYNNYIHRDNK